MNITLTIDVKPEVLSLLKEFLQLLSANAPATAQKKAEPKASGKAMEVVKDEKEPAATETPALASKSEGAVITLEQVRAAAQAKQQEGKREGIKALLVEFDAKNVSTLSKEHYPTFLKKVQAL